MRLSAERLWLSLNIEVLLMKKKKPACYRFTAAQQTPPVCAHQIKMQIIGSADCCHVVLQSLSSIRCGDSTWTLALNWCKCAKSNMLRCCGQVSPWPPQLSDTTAWVSVIRAEVLVCLSFNDEEVPLRLGRKCPAVMQALKLLVKAPTKASVSFLV